MSSTVGRLPVSSALPATDPGWGEVRMKPAEAPAAPRLQGSLAAAAAQGSASGAPPPSAARPLASSTAPSWPTAAPARDPDTAPATPVLLETVAPRSPATA
jgi:hypothetical protein